jgi:hypothetical protein
MDQEPESRCNFLFWLTLIIKRENFKYCPNGVVGYHPTKLPENRGGIL